MEFRKDGRFTYQESNSTYDPYLMGGHETGSSLRANGTWTYDAVLEQISATGHDDFNKPRDFNRTWSRTHLSGFEYAVANPVAVSGPSSAGARAEAVSEQEWEEYYEEIDEIDEGFDLVG